jgi:putative ABC transport system permease protein
MRSLRLAWRQLAAEPGYSAVTILGLAAGFATCFVLMMYVAFTHGYNRHVPDVQDVHAVKWRPNFLHDPLWLDAVPAPFLGAAQRTGMAGAAAMALGVGGGVEAPGGMLRVTGLAVTPGFPAVFGTRAAQGDLAQALSRPDAVALTWRTAEKITGTRRVLGKVLRIDGKNLTVLALLDDPPAASALRYGMLVGVDSVLVPQDQRRHLESEWGMVAGQLFVRLAPGITQAAFTDQLQRAVDAPFEADIPAPLRARLAGRRIVDVGLTPLLDLYFDPDLAGIGNRGDRKTVLGLGAVGILVLLLAAANYVNLATVRALRRQPEIVLRKVLGAGAVRLAGLFLAEALLVALLATALGLVIAWLLLPMLSVLLDQPLDEMAAPATLLAALATGALTGLLAGLYPAWVALDMRPSAALAARREHESRGGLWLRRTLTVLQLTVAMGLTAGTLAVAWQTRHASSADPGFDPAPLLVLELPRALSQSPEGRQLREALRHLPHVQGVAYAENGVGQPIVGLNDTVRGANGMQATLVHRSVSTDFFQVYGARAPAGRAFDPAIEEDGKLKGVMLNAEGAKALGFDPVETAVGAVVHLSGADRATTVIGIAPHLRQESLRERPRPMLYLNYLDAHVLTIRTDGATREVAHQAEAAFRRYFPDDIPAVRSAASYLAENHAQDLRLATLLGAASAVAIVLSAFGVYTLSAYNVQRRAREIVLRKLYGAGRPAIARLLGREYLVLLGAGALIGLPPAALAIHAYLARFVDHAPIGGWTLLGAAAIAVLVAMLATARHTIAALRAAPAAVLRG